MNAIPHVYERTSGPVYASCNGILIVGDPHQTSRRPGKRIDGDWQENVLDGLAQCITVGNRENLLIVILGDLFDRARENDHTFLVRLIRVLRAAWRRPIIIPGNHDLVNSVLTSDTTLAILAEAGVLDVFPQVGPMAIVDVPSPTPDGRTGPRMLVGIGGTPYGQGIPRSVEGIFDVDLNEMRAEGKVERDTQIEMVMWLTHEDLDIGASYPGAKPTFEMKGCDIVINGHMHTPMPPVWRGKTVWFNPGNITRLSRADIERDEAAWAWKPDPERQLPREDWMMGYMNQRTLDLPKDVFDLTGTRVKAADAEDAVGADEDGHSVFVDLLKEENALDREASSDAVVMSEQVRVMFENLEAEGQAQNPMIMRLILDLADPDWKLDEYLDKVERAAEKPSPEKAAKETEEVAL